MDKTKFNSDLPLAVKGHIPFYEEGLAEKVTESARSFGIRGFNNPDGNIAIDSVSVINDFHLDARRGNFIDIPPVWKTNIFSRWNKRRLLNKGQSWNRKKKRERLSSAEIQKKLFNRFSRKLKDAAFSIRKPGSPGIGRGSLKPELLFPIPAIDSKVFKKSHLTIARGKYRKTPVDSKKIYYLDNTPHFGGEHSIFK